MAINILVLLAKYDTDGGIREATYFYVPHVYRVPRNKKDPLTILIPMVLILLGGSFVTGYCVINPTIGLGARL